MTGKRYFTRSGFTLVELLVVVGIIAVLISMLLPTLRKAQEAARSAACMSNVRQCVLGFQQYARDYQDCIPIMRTKSDGNITLWPWFMIAGHDTADNVAMKPYIRQKVAVCPSAPEVISEIAIPEASASDRGYALFTVNGDETGGSSQTVFRFSKFQNKTVVPIGALTSTFIWQKLVRLPTRSSATVMMGDSRCGTPGAPQFGPGDARQMGNFTDQSQGPKWQCRISTHHGFVGNGRANVAFYDGHVESLEAGELRNRTESKIKLTWSRTWQDINWP